MSQGVRVLVVGEQRERLAGVAERLEAEDRGLSATVAASPDDLQATIAAGEVDCLVVDAPRGRSDALVVLAASGDVDVPLVVLSGDIETTIAEAAGEAEAVVPADGDEPGAGLAGHVRAAVEDAADPSPLSLLAPLSEPAWLLRDGAVVAATDACAAVLNRDPGRLPGTPIEELFAPDDRDAAVAHYEEIAAGEGARTDELTAIGPWDSRTTVEVSGRQLDDEGTVVGVLADVTDARLDERRLGALFEELGLPVAEVALADGRAVVRRVNDAFAETFGLGEAAAGEHLGEHVVPDDEDAEERAIDLYLRAERGARVSETLPRATVDGWRDFEVQAVPFDAAGERRAMLTYVDVDERTSRERSLEEVQAATRDLLAAPDRTAVAQVGVAALQRVLDVALAVVYGYDEEAEALVPLAASDAAREQFGEVPTVERGGGPTWYVFEMGDTLVADDVSELNAEPDRPVTSELVVPVEDHGLLVASSTERAAFDGTDEALARTLASTLGAALDRAEREALLREREQRLRRQNERLDEFAGIVSHDLRSPLTVIKGNASLLADEHDPEYLERIEAAADRMDTLIEDLLALARQGDSVDETTYVDLEDVVSDAWTTAETRDATLSVDAEVAVEADPGRLQQLLENLFNNAVEHGGDDVTVRVGTIPSEDRGAAGFYVADDGAGLPEDADELFEAGVTGTDNGTGFGLAIVQRIAEAHGWSVTAGESEAGGARFAFTDVRSV